MELKLAPLSETHRTDIYGIYTYSRLTRQWGMVCHSRTLGEAMESAARIAKDWSLSPEYCPRIFHPTHEEFADYQACFYDL
jgi:hypothetical protein